MVDGCDRPPVLVIVSVLTPQEKFSDNKQASSKGFPTLAFFLTHHIVIFNQQWQGQQLTNWLLVPTVFVAQESWLVY